MRLVILNIFLFIAFSAICQDADYARKVIKDLCAVEMYGRGYVKNGDRNAAMYIKNAIKQAKLKPLGNEYIQEYGFPVIAFGGDITFEIDKHQLIPGEHFIVSPGCPQVYGSYEMLWIDSGMVDNNTSFQQLQKKNLRNTFLVITHLKTQNLIHKERIEMVLNNQLNAKGLIFAAEKKLTWSVATAYDKFPKIYVLEGWLKPYQLSCKLNIESEYKTHSTQNLAGFIQGTTYSDSFIVYTAHYDHLGMMGLKTMFPGANDNASGVAMLLDLMRYYNENKPKYNVAFLFFSGEEAGLFGSYYYTQNPLFPLKKIALLLNLDLMGTGDKGLTAVNATLFKEEFELLQMVNMEGEYLSKIAPRGVAKNSDHYYFTENGVKSFFFYLMGDYHFYHDVFDTEQALPLSNYRNSFLLITDFVKEYQNSY